jgi:tetratricopeptide (TPR) repeat protein
MGNVHLARTEYEAAARVFEDALRYCEGHQLPDNHVIVVMIKHRLAEAEKHLKAISREDEVTVLERQAEEEAGSGDLDKAIETLTKVMAMRKALLKAKKASKQDASEEKYLTACTLVTFGKVLLAKDDNANAQRALADAEKLFKKSGSEKDLASLKEVAALLDKLESKS